MLTCWKCYLFDLRILSKLFCSQPPPCSGDCLGVMYTSDRKLAKCLETESHNTYIMFTCTPPRRMSLGVPSAFLPLLHASLMHYSLPLANWLTRHDYELYGKNDLRFLEGLYKVWFLPPPLPLSLAFLSPLLLPSVSPSISISLFSLFLLHLFTLSFPSFKYFFPLFQSFTSFVPSPSGVTRRVPLPPTADERAVSLHRVCWEKDSAYHRCPLLLSEETPWTGWKEIGQKGEEEVWVREGICMGTIGKGVDITPAFSVASDKCV